MELTVDIRKKLGDFRLDVRFRSRSRRIGILGPSGCGKSMALKCIAGIETPDAGKIETGGRLLFDGEKKIHVRPQERKVGYLFQNYALFPTMTAEQNIAAGLKGSREENRRRVREMLERFRIAELAKRYPGELSGGQQQRVALARIMAYEPDMILLDEPFSALDVFLRDRLQREMEEMLEDYRGTVILVSHSRDEIYRFSEDLLVMDQGHTVIFGDTGRIFENPIRKEAAVLTGCKNFAKIRRISAHTALAPAWGLELSLCREIPENASCIGYRAHDFVPVWEEMGGSGKNRLKVRPGSMAKLPFEEQYYLLADVPEESGKEAKDPDERTVCWFVQRDMQKVIQERGLPGCLELKEEKILFLE